MSAEPVGVLGGIGPLATAHFLRRVVDLTVAERDQDHLDLIVWNIASTPDRTAYLLGKSADNPGPALARSARALQQAGARFIAVPCNTASAFRQEITEGLGIEVLDTIGITIGAAIEAASHARSLGVLATDGTIKTGLYAAAAERFGLDTIIPTPLVQGEVMSMIYDGVKAGNPVSRNRFEDAVDHLLTRGADAVLLACTELPILRVNLGVQAPEVIDSIDAVAIRTITLAGKSVRSAAS